MLWLVSPAGLENFFKAIGRSRPADGVELERAAGMTYQHPAIAEED